MLSLQQWNFLEQIRLNILQFMFNWIILPNYRKRPDSLLAGDLITEILEEKNVNTALRDLIKLKVEKLIAGVVMLDIIVQLLIKTQFLALLKHTILKDYHMINRIVLYASTLLQLGRVHAYKQGS